MTPTTTTPTTMTPTTVPATTVPERSSPARPRSAARLRRHRRTWGLALLATAAFGAALAFVTANEVQANTQVDQAHASLVSTWHHIDRVVADLGTVQRRLAEVKGQVGAASAALAQDASQLQAAQRGLAGARADVWDQASTINDLQTCVGGVEQASNALAVADQARAITVLDLVATSCKAAVSSGG